MEADDLADLLERELALLDDVDDDDEQEVVFDADFLKRKSVDELPNTVIDEELEQLLLSANALPILRSQIISHNHETVKTIEESFEPSIDIQDNIQTLCVADHIESPVAVELTEEERQVITELMTLMIESVERCAPILTRTELTPSQIDTTMLLMPIEELTIISDDSQIAIQHLSEAPLLSVSAAEDRSQEISLLDDRLFNEAKLQTQNKITFTQHNDKVVWDETNRFKQALEAERQRIEDRRRTREAAKVQAQRENAAEHIQRIARGSLSRRTTAPLRQQHTLLLQQREAERLHNITLQEQALRDSILAEELKNQSQERQSMGVNEYQCRKVWEELHRWLESQRLSEIRLMTTEDECGAHIRDVITQAKLKLQNYAVLAAQEDVEYDIFGDSETEISDTESETEIDSEIPDTPRVAEHSTAASGHHIAAPPTITTANNTTTVTAGTTARTTSTVSTVDKQYRVAPPKSRPGVSVDPRQGRKFGGAFINTSATSTTNTNTSADAVSAVSTNNDINSGSGSNSANVGSTHSINTNNTYTTPNSNTTTLTAVPAYTVPTMTAAERQALEATWCSMVGTANSSIHSSVGYDVSGVSVASSALSVCFGSSSSVISGSTVSATSSGSSAREGKSDIILALQHWQRWSVQYAKVLADLNTFTTANTTTHTTTAHNTTTSTTTTTGTTHTNTTSDVPHNSMLDTHAHPTLLSELDLCVEGITSTAFLSEYTNLLKLTLNVNKITSLQGVQSLSQIVTLSVKDNKLTNIDALSSLHSLRFCYLDTNKITSLTPLNGLHNLSILTVNSNALCDMPVLQCNALSRLELCRNKITTIPAYSLRYLPHLTHLNMSSNQIHSICGETVSMCGLLQTLILSENLLTQVPAPLRLPLLRNLRLNLNRIENVDAWVHASGGFGNTSNDSSGDGGTSVGSNNTYPLFTPSLQKLVLSDNHLTSLHSSVFVALPLLEEVDLSFNALPSRECVQGIEQCKLLTAIHIQDNLFTTVPVNTGAAAGTSRTALPSALLTPLLHYLVDLCPTLQTVSGNRLDPKEFSERLTSTRGVYLRNHYLTHGVWLAADFDIREVVYSAHPAPVRTLLQLLQAHGTQQNLLIVKERAVKREEGNSKTKPTAANTTINNNSTNNSTPAKRDWEQETITMLTAQRTQLFNLFTNNNTCTTTNSTNYCVFTSYTKATPVYTDSHTTVPVPALSPPLPLEYAVFEIEYIEHGTGDNNTNNNGTSDSNITSATDGHTQSTTGGSFYLTQPDISEPTHTNTVNNNATNTTHRAALNIQRHYRGHHLRRKLHTALQSITYHDAELDALFNTHNTELDEYNDILDMSYLEEPVMVYGDHIRKRSRPGTGKSGSAGSDSGMGGVGVGVSSGTNSNGVAASTDNWVLPHDNPVRTTYNVKVGSGLSSIDIHTGGGGSEYQGAYGGYGTSAESSRPDTGLSARSIDAPDRAAQPFSGASSPAHSMLSARSGLSGITDTPHSARSRATAAQLGQEWGISDPRVLASMVKRSNKIRVAEDVKDRRELEKDPLYRLQQFQKTAHKSSPAGNVQPANTRTSGSFGGAPKTTRGAGGHAKRKNLPLPAWMLGQQGGQDGEES